MNHAIAGLNVNSDDLGRIDHLAALIMTFVLLRTVFTPLPCAVFCDFNFTTSVDMTLALATW